MRGAKGILVNYLMSRKVNTLAPAENQSLKFVQNCFFVLFFVTPLLLWPFTSEVFEFNKMIFVYAMTVLIGAGWAIRSIQEKKVEIARTPLDLPLVLFFASQIASTIYSIDRHTSLWGYYSRFHGGLVSTICYIFLYYALVTHFSGQAKAIRNLIIAILTTAVLTSFYAVLERLGIDKNVWVQDVQNRVFSTLGQPNWLSAYLIALLPLSLFGFLNTKNLNLRLLYITLSGLFLLAILFTRSQSGIGATVVVLLLFAVIASLQKKQPKALLGLALLIFAVLLFKGQAIGRTLQSLNKTNPFFSDTTTIITEENKTRIGGTDSMAIRRVVWQGAVELGKKYPFFGTGVETFGYSYYWVRPAAHNLTSESDFLYNKAHNEYLNFLATTGFIGLATYLFLIGSILKLFIKTRDQELKSPLLLGFISILITNYFGFSVVNIALFFFLFPAILISVSNQSRIVSQKISLNQSFGLFLVLAIALWLLLGVRRLWIADLAYTAGRSNISQDLEAVRLNPQEPLYLAQLGNIQALVAIQIIEPQIRELPATASAEIRDRAAGILNQYLQDAVSNVNKAVSMNKYNLNLLKTKARTELSLAQLDPKYNLEAIQTLLKITELSPTDASNFYNIGLLYAGLAQIASESKVLGANTDAKSSLDSAKRAFERALELKPDFEAAKDRLKLLK